VLQAPEFQEVRGAVLLRFGGPSGIGLGGW
jgi:hypothetical protein